MATSTAQVLVVDEDARHAASVRELLSAHGYRADFIIDGGSGLDRLGAATIDVLILGLDLPELAGPDILRALQRRNPAIKTIIVSGASSCDGIAPLLRLGVFDFLAKPYEPEQLVQSVRDALDRTAGERTQQMRQHHREAFLCALPDLVYLLDAHGRFSFVGDRLSDVFGFDRASLLGRPWTELVGATLVEPLRHRFDERRSGERATRRLDFEWRDPRGSLHVIELSATGMYGGERPRQAEFCGTSGSLRDVTATRREAVELAASERRYREMFDTAPIATFVSRLTDGQLIECNDAFRALFADNTDDSDAIVFGDAAARDAFVYALPRHSEQTVFECRGNDASRSLALQTRRFSVDGTEYLHATVTDVTPQARQLDDRIARLSQQYRKQLHDTVRQLSSAIAHDFNELLARVIAYSEGIRDAMSGVEHQRSGRLLDELFATTRRARDLISQLLLSVETVAETPLPVPADSGDVVIIDAATCIGQLLRECLQQAGFAARAFADSESALEYIASDPAMIALVLLDEPQTDARIARVALRIHALPDAPPVVTMRGSGAMPLGPGTPAAAVAGTIAKPFSTDTLLAVVRGHARQTRRAVCAALP